MYVCEVDKRVDRWWVHAWYLVPLSCIIHPRAGFMVFVQGWAEMKSKLLQLSSAPMSLPCVYLIRYMHVARSPRPSASIFAYYRLEVGMALE